MATRTVKMSSEEEQEIQQNKPEAVVETLDERLTDIESQAATASDSNIQDGEDGESDSEEYVSDQGIAIETMDPKLEVWPDGPTVGQTLAWKEEFGEVYTTSLTMDFHVMWRPINRMEYKRHVKQMEQLSQSGKLSPVELNMYQEEALTEMCVLFPAYSRSDMSNELAGMPSIIAQQVMEASGFTALEVRQL
jgi:hypothetical protein